MSRDRGFYFCDKAEDGPKNSFAKPSKGTTPRLSAKIPFYAAADFRIGIFPAHRAFVAGVHTGAALDAVFELEVYLPNLIQGVAVGRAHACGGLMPAFGVADIGVYFNVRLGLGLALIQIIDLSEPFGNA